ncbi:MAG: hypothetical protein ACJ8MR_00345 [Povalibacter sp.]
MIALSGSSIAGNHPAALPPLLPEAEEIQSALEGAPAHLRERAGVFVLKSTGYVRARETRNGFTCLLVREWSRSFEPTCFDPEGTASILPVILFRTEQVANGTSDAGIRAAVAEGYRTGKFRAPQRVGVAYMLSKRNIVVLDHETKKVGGAPPHLMFYSPYMSAEDFGTTADFASHFGVADEGTPTAMIIVPVELGGAEHAHKSDP